MLPNYDSSKQVPLFCSTVENLTWHLHFHEQIEILYVREGEIEVSIFNQCQRLVRDDIAIIFPQNIHSFNTPRHSLVYLIIFGEQLFPDFHIMFRNNQPVFPYVKADIASHDLPEIVSSLFKYINDLAEPLTSLGYAFENDWNLWMAKGYIQIMLCHIFNAIQLTDSKSNPCDNSLMNCVRYITENFRNKICLEDIAKHAGISRVHTSRIFSNKIGCSFIEYLYALRVEYAAHLMQTTDMSILDVCYESGFESLSTFYYYFKQKYNMPPKKYLTKQKNNPTFDS